MGREPGWSGRWAIGLVALALLTHCGGDMGVEERTVEEPPRVTSTTAQGLSTTLTFGASADARVEAASPTRNFGSASSLGADLSPNVESYLRFHLSGLTGTVTRATLRLYASDGTSDGPRVFLSEGGWAEGGFTWNNRPALLEGPLDDKGAISSNTWVELDVTGVVRGNGELNLALVATSGNGTDFYSRESSRSDLRPQLVVTVEPAPPPPPGCMPRLESFVFGAEPMEDGFVSRDAPGRSFGGEPALRVDGSPRLESYLKFFASTQGMRVRDAKLELSAFDPTSDGPVLHRASDEWNEGLTWNTRPSLLEGPLGNLGAINAGTRVAYDVTRVVTSEGIYSFGLIPESSNGVDFYSREVLQRELRPTLRLTLETPLFCSYRGMGGGLTRWVRQYGGRGNERLHALATSPEGGFVAAGLFGDALFPEEEGLVLARYSVEGLHLWTRVVATDDVQARELTLTRPGDILVVGNYEGTPDLGAGRLPPLPEEAAGMEGFFIARFSPTGETVWTRGFMATDASGIPLPVFPEAVATDAEGNLIVTGSFQGRMNLGGDVLSSGPTTDPSSGPPIAGFLAKFSGDDGRPLWSRTFEASDTTRTTGGDAVATDAGNNLLVAGRASPRTDLGDGLLGEYAPFIAKYSPSGSLLWKRVFSGAEGGLTGVRPQGADRVVFIGNLAGTFTFAGETSSSPPFLLGGFLGALTHTGADLWIRDLGLNVRLRELAVSGDGALTVLGQGLGEFDVGGGPLGVDLRVSLLPFVARYSREGEHRWSRAVARGLSPHLGLHPGGAVLLGSDFGPRPVEVDGRVFTPRGESDLLYLELSSSPEDGGSVRPARPWAPSPPL
ncbi:DUF7594 domain-containing protein [Archangium sp.]|uniref:CBM96 family carbohydrate-binding protein n=1 Tax=Archangium sp. TaxID=1872627 RepID=UPI002D5F76E6|nr:DNRLRE domain-containing protein [Archangium sp.]HYO56340.1 DNRLRE domain-containing protein [Archangium sp.]